MASIARSPAPASIARAAFSGDLSESVQMIDITYTIYLTLKQALDRLLPKPTHPTLPPSSPKSETNYRNQEKKSEKIKKIVKPTERKNILKNLYFHRFLRGS